MEIFLVIFFIIAALIGLWALLSLISGTVKSGGPLREKRRNRY